MVPVELFVAKAQAVGSEVVRCRGTQDVLRSSVIFSPARVPPRAGPLCRLGERPIRSRLGTAELAAQVPGYASR